ncbi:MAG: class I SAM-dependent methyltransferase [Candidatus Omnitrophica bacterium]|nr:class I SAM-dependent methyltransferase [Candidatus Omnitrophota bacterium]
MSHKTDTPKQKIIPPEIYTKDYYLSDNEGCDEYSKNLDTNIHDKFKRCLELAHIQPGDITLDVGCGRGELVYYAVKQGAQKAIGIDYSKDAVELSQETFQRLPEHLKEKTQAYVGTAENFQFTDKFNVIFMLETAEHMFDWQLAQTFQKFEEILTDDGRIIMMTPNYLYEQYLQPWKLFLDIPFRLIKWPSRILRGKYKPKNFKELLHKIFHIRKDRGERNRQMHCNITTPNRLQRLLKNFDAQIWCEDPSWAPISLLLKKWMGREIIIVAKKKQ